MLVVCVTVQVKPGMGAQFLEAALADREGTRKEPGNIRFDVLQSTTPAKDGEPEQFFLFEIYTDAEAFAAHQQTPHYFAFRDGVAGMMAEPRKGIRYEPVYADSFVPSETAVVAVPNTEPTG